MNKIREFASANPERYRFLSRISFHKDFCTDGGYRGTIEIVLLASPSQDARALTLVLHDTAEIKIGDINASVCVLTAIYELSAFGLEGQRYKVIDDENLTFSISCGDFEFSRTS